MKGSRNELSIRLCFGIAMDCKTRVLVIDDDRMMCRLLMEYLAPHGYTVLMAHSGEEGIAQIVSTQIDVVILDVMLPGMDGFTVLKRIRARANVPVLILTGRGEERERITGLDAGADDYIPKTFSHRELLARLNAVLRRTKAIAPEEIVESGGIFVNAAKRLARRHETRLDLTAAEFDILLALMRARGRVLSREQLLHASERSLEVSDRSIDVHVSSLRKKLGEDSKSVGYIETVRSLGYRFREEEQG